jgi:hypothetical protein
LEIAHDPAQASSESNEAHISGKKPIGLVPSCVITPSCCITFITLNYVTFVEVNGIAPAEENWFIVFIITSGATRCASGQGVAHWRSAPALSLVCRNNGVIVGGIDCLERQRPSC